MGVDKAASNAKGNDVASRADDSNLDAGNDINNNAKRGGQLRAAKKGSRYDARGVRAATTPYNSNDDPDNSVNKAKTPRATDKGDKAMWDGT